MRRLAGVLLLFMLAHVACLAQQPAREPLVVYGDASFPPYESTADGAQVGANVELWQAIGRVLGRRIDLRLISWPEAQQQVLGGAGHALSFLNINEDRQRLYDFTQPTFTFRFPVFVRADEVSRFNTQEMLGKRIAVKMGGFPASVLGTTRPEAIAVPVDSVASGFRMLLRGEVDGVIETEWVGYHLLRQHGFTGIRATPGALAVRTAHIAVPKGNADLVGELSRAVKLLADSGEIDAIADRWAGEGFVFWERRAFVQVAIAGAAGLLGLLGCLAAFYVLRTRRSNRELRGEIAKRMATEAKLQAAQESMQAIMDHTVDGLITIDQRGTVLNFNKPAAQMFGYAAAEVVGRNVSMLMPPPYQAEHDRYVRNYLTTGQAKVIGIGREVRGRRKDGSVFPMDVAVGEIPGEPGSRRFLGTVRDITQRLLTEDQLRQSQKMDAVGQLAGGVAHDFNNILSVIMGFADMLREDLPQGTAAQGYAERVVNAAERAKALVQQILAFSRRANVERGPRDLALLALEARDLLRATLPASTKLEVNIAGDGLVAEVDAGQVSQILINLCVNANDAIGGRTGSIVIDLAAVHPGDADFAIIGNGGALAPDGGTAEGCITAGTLDPARSYARIRVSDTGEGIAHDVLRRIFEPFFTTKERGHGTGLGLSVVHGVVMSYQGACVVTSQPGGGTVFTVYIPLSNALPAASVAKVAGVRGSERILVVDDEPDLVDLLTIGLTRLGYDVVAVNDPEAALAVFASNPDSWHVVISDQVMPHMKGRTLFDRLKLLKPSLRFILCTGFSDEQTEAAALRAGIDAFFLKPVSPAQIAAAIRQMLDRPVAVPGE